MFYWRSNVLRNYGRGWIVVAAPDVDAARYIARREWDAFAKEQWHYLDEEELAERRVAFEDEILEEPQQHTVLFITGSE